MNQNVNEIDFSNLNFALDQVQIKMLEDKIANLRKICDEINPYEPLNISMQERLLEVDIHDFSDPFKITNALIKNLEDAMEELNRLKPFMHDEN